MAAGIMWPACAPLMLQKQKLLLYQHNIGWNFKKRRLFAGVFYVNKNAPGFIKFLRSRYSFVIKYITEVVHDKCLFNISISLAANNFKNINRKLNISESFNSRWRRC
jgi:hypothetical protein